MIAKVWTLGAMFCLSSLQAQSGARPYVPPEYPPTLSDRFPPTLPHAALRPVRLRGEQFNAEPAIVRPSTMVIQGRWLWMNDEVGDPFIHVIDLSSGSVVRSIGRAGEGPGDFRNVMQMMHRPGDATGIWAYDMTQRRLTRVPRDPSAGLRTTIRAQTPGTALRLIWVKADRILIVGSSDSARIAFADPDGRVKSIMPGPVLGHPEVPLPSRIGASEGVQVCPHPSGDRFAIAYSNAARVDLYGGDGSFLGVMRGLPWGLEQGDFVRNARGVWGLPRVRYYYRSCTATTQYYFGLFAGRTDAAAADGTKRWDSPFVHVFDWTGVLRMVIELDQFAEGIAVDGDSVLYAGGGAMEGIYKYRLPPGLMSTGGRQ